MIDTDNYEGHSPQDEWKLRHIEGPTVAFLTPISDEEKATLTSYWLTCPATSANTQLIADAALILEDYKRLGEVIEDTYNEIAKGGVSVFPGWKGDRALEGLKELCILIGVYKGGST